MAETGEKKRVAGGPVSPREWDMATGSWGALSEEPCRYCRRPGGVRFRLDDDPLTAMGTQVVRCDLCGMAWEADSPLA